MTIAAFWARHAHDGRAVLIWADYGPELWMVRLAKRYVLVDDTIGGHLRDLDPEADAVQEMIRWWSKYRRGMLPARYRERAA